MRLCATETLMGLEVNLIGKPAPHAAEAVSSQRTSVLIMLDAPADNGGRSHSRGPCPGVRDAGRCRGGMVQAEVAAAGVGNAVRSLVGAGYGVIAVTGQRRGQVVGVAGHRNAVRRAG